MNQLIFILVAAFAGLTGCKQRKLSQTRDDFKKYYDQYGVSGTVALYDQAQDKFVIYNKDQYKQPFHRSPLLRYAIH